MGGTALVAAINGVPGGLASRTPATTKTEKLVAFPLQDVHLLESPFLGAQRRDFDYLVSLQPESDAPQLQGERWPRTQGACVRRMGIRGAVGGNPLSRSYARSLPLRGFAHVRVDRRPADEGARRLHRQRAAGMSEGDAERARVRVPRRRGTARKRSSGPSVCRCAVWYTMHKIFAGLRDAHVHTGSTAALDVLTKLADWTETATSSMTDEQMQKMLGTEHGGMNEVLADVSVLTGQTKYLTLARRFSHQALLTPLAEARDPLDGLHANTQIPKAVGFQRIFELTGEDRYGTAARFFWQTVVERRSFVTGGHGDEEHSPAGRLRQASPVRKDDGDVLHAQHAAADAHAVPVQSVRHVRGLLRARAL